jgi:hypothetical protein
MFKLIDGDAARSMEPTEEASSFGPVRRTRRLAEKVAKKRGADGEHDAAEEPAKEQKTSAVKTDKWVQCEVPECQKWRCVDDSDYKRFSARSFKCDMLGTGIGCSVEDDRQGFSEGEYEQIEPSRELQALYVNLAMTAVKKTGKKKSVRLLDREGEMSRTGVHETDRQALALTAQAMQEQGGEVASVPAGKVLTATDAARYSWQDLTREEQKASRGRAMEDYYRYDCFGRTSTVGDVKKKDPECQIYSGTWADKAVVRDGLVIGKSRYAPRVFEERGSWRGMYDAPTAHALTH